MKSDIEAIPKMGGMKLKDLPLPHQLTPALAIKTAKRLKRSDIEMMARKRRRLLRKLIDQGFVVLRWPDRAEVAYRCHRQLNDIDICHLYDQARQALEDTAIFRVLER